jgi:uncharacterized protein affecting Mg2+/Co2+ transport
MKFSGALLLFVALAVIPQAQTPPANSPETTNLSVVKFSWSKERINWEGDPFGGPVENFDDMRVRTRNDKRLEVNKGGVEEERVRREVKADAANQQLLRQQRNTARYVFMYKITLRNDGAKPIRAVDWDYIFCEKGTTREVGRREFTSDEKIAPGKSKELTVVARLPPAQIVSVQTLNDKERDALDGRVEIVRVEYADGSVWKRP